MTSKSNLISTPISVGELFDKVSVLSVKMNKIKDESKVNDILHELNLLKPLCEPFYKKTPELSTLMDSLRVVNSELWDILELQRNKEKDGQLDQQFIDLSISVYRKNDRRFFIKQEINKLTSSEIKEQKYYSNDESHS
jgi:hypothetical protein